jgi:hypothetical protein
VSNLGVPPIPLPAAFCEASGPLTQVRDVSRELESPGGSIRLRGPDMATDERDDHAGGSGLDAVDPRGLDPRNTDHPTGSQQAAENAAEDPPS